MSKGPNQHRTPRYDKQKEKGPQVHEANPNPSTARAVQPKAENARIATPSTVVTLDPLAPLICRSGRPFDDQAGPDGARFPPPSTIAGCLRTAWAREHGKPLGPDLMTLAVAGPVLARPTPGDSLRLYAPKPADAIYFGSGEDARCVRAAPTRFREDSGADLPDGLLPVCLTQDEEEKPGKGPAWWAWDDLLAFRTGQPLAHDRLSKGGWSPSNGDRRTHVAIDPATLAAQTGQLFQTEGLDLSPPAGLKDDPLSGLRLLARCAEPLAPALVHLGGERRLSRVEPQPQSVWPEPPKDWIEGIETAKGLSLTLLTPALFAAGYRPGWLEPGPGGRLIGRSPEASGVQLRLCAAALGRWLPHSGWDLAAQRPRAGRKLVPAGAVYWFEILGTPSVEALTALWLTSLCDHPQDCRDGFGLALPAAWNPNAVIEYNSYK